MDKMPRVQRKTETSLEQTSIFIPFAHILGRMTIEQVPAASAVRDALVSRISSRIESGLAVLFLVSGGSTSPVAVSVCDRLAESFHDRRKALKGLFSVTLTDERYGPAGHGDSNWRLLLENGLDPARFDAFPVLSGDDHGLASPEDTARRFDAYLSEAALRRERGKLFIAGLFGIGADGHTAGILPESPASRISPESKIMATEYRSPLYHRITVTPAFIARMDFAAACALDQSKRQAIEDLASEGGMVEQPVRALALAGESVIYTLFNAGNA